MKTAARKTGRREGQRDNGTTGVSRNRVTLASLEEAEQTLRDSEQRYRSFVERNPDAVFCLDTEGRVTELNNAAVELTGYTAEELLGRNWQEFCHPDHIDETMRNFKAAAAGEFRALETVLIRKDGSEMELYVTGGPLIVRNEVQGVFAIARDLTDLRKTEESLRIHQAELEMQNEQLRQTQAELEMSHHVYSDLFDFAPIGYFVLDEKGVISELNLTGASLVGTERSFLIGTPFSVCISKGDQDSFYLSRRQVFDSGVSTRCDLKIRRKDGGEFFAEALIDPVVGADDKVTYCRVALIDIGARKQAEQALHEREQELKLIIESGHIGTWDWDVQANRVDRNDILYEILGVGPGAVGSAAEDFMKQVHSEDRSRVQEELQHALEHGEEWRDEFRIVRPDRQVRWLVARARVVRDENGKAVRMLGVNYDVTRVRSAEEQIRNLAKFPAQSPLPILRLSGDGTVLYSNTPGRVLLKEWGCDVDQKAPKDWCRLVKKALRFKDGLEKDIECGRKIFSFALSPVSGAGYVNLYGRDITKRVQMERALEEVNRSLEEKIAERTAEVKQANRHLRSQAELLDLAHDAITVHNLDGKIIFWNRGAETAYGWKRQEVLGKVTHEVLKTKFSEPLMKIVSTVSTNGSWEGELTQTTRRGKEVTVQSRWVLQRGENGKPVAILEIGRDITDRKAAELRTQEARRYAESIIETVQEALVVLDAHLKVISANKSFYKLFGLTPEQTEGEHIYRLGRNQWDIPELRKLLEEILPRNASFEDYEMTYAPSKGQTRDLLLNARRIYQERRKTEMILLAIQDVTARNQQERQIRELTEELLLAEEEQRQYVATALHDSISQMLAFSKRELALLLRNSDLRTDSSIKKVLESIDKSLRQTRELTADLSSPTLHTFGLEAALEEMAEQFAHDHRITCRFENGGAMPSLEKKVELLLYRSVKELLCNVAKHAKARNVAINAKTTEDILEVTVADDGRGFDPSRLEANRNKKKSFGLFSVEQRLKNVNGSFRIESEKKKGTRVVLQVLLDTARGQKGK
jgi:PAS domain S-box-containing protein